MKEGSVLLDYLKTLKQKAVSTHPAKTLEKYNKYYFSESHSEDVDGKSTSKTNYNMIKPIIDTKSTLVLDQNLSTQVTPRAVSHATFNEIQSIQDKAQILNDCLQHVLYNNKYPNLESEFAKSAMINGVSICKVFWDAKKDEGLGNVGLEFIEPLNFYPDPSATSIETCNYIFVKKVESLFDLKKKFENDPEMLEKINKLVSEPETSKEKGSMWEKVQKSTGSVTYTNDTTTSTQYVTKEDNKLNYKKTTQNVVLWECYIKDDSIFIDPDSDNSSNNESLSYQRLKYPNGRVITYSNDVIIEDKPIDYPFGFPFELYSPVYAPNSIFGYSQVRDLQQLQDRLDRGYDRVRNLVADHMDIIINPVQSGISEDDLIRGRNVITLDYGALSEGAFPQLFSTNTIGSIGSMLQYLETIKSDMMDIGRVNKMMISGERPVGVSSGQMVEDLNESPMTSIRDQQRKYSEFLIGISNKIITLIQLYYTQARILRITTGEFIEFLPIMEEGDQPSTILRKYIINKHKQVEMVQELKGDLSIAEYEVKITSGSNMPRSRSETARLTLNLAQQGFFGPIEDPDVKRFLLESLDYPNYHAVIEKYEERITKDSESKDQDDLLLEVLQRHELKPKDLIDMIDKLPDSFIAEKSEAIIRLLKTFNLLTLSSGPSLAVSEEIPPPLSMM